MGKVIQLCNEWVQNIYPDFIADREGKQSFAGNYIDIENNRFEGFRFWKMKSKKVKIIYAMRLETSSSLQKKTIRLSSSIAEYNFTY